MTIKKLLLICLSFLLFSVTLTGIFSENGYLVNRSLKARYEALKQREELYEVRLKALERQRDSLSEDSALDDLALRLGYNREGEKVFYFETPDETENVRTYADDPLPVQRDLYLDPSARFGRTHHPCCGNRTALRKEEGRI